jgi:alpha-galactosidase
MRPLVTPATRHVPQLLALCLACAIPTVVQAQAAAISADSATRSWTLSSGDVMWRLATRSGQLVTDYFGPGGPAARWDSVAGRYPSVEFEGFADREPLVPPAMRLVRVESLAPTPSGRIRELRVTMRHAARPLDVEARYVAWGETGVFTRRLVIRNHASVPTTIASADPLLAFSLPTGDWTMRTLWGGWGQERQLAVEPVRHGARRFEQTFGRSSRGVVPWLSLRDEARGVEYVAELAWSGNWWMEVERHPDFNSQGLRDRPLSVRFGLHHDFGGTLTIAAGDSLLLPAVVVTAARGTMDDATNRMHRWQREHVVPRQPANIPPLVQFNTWYPFNDHIAIDTLLRSADVAAALGAEVYIVDSGWYSEEGWWAELGDYQVSRRKFPRGLEELSRHVRQLGMKFGLWVEIENVGVRSRLHRAHPDWCLALAGRPLVRDDRCQLDFAKPEVRAWATSTVDRLVRDYGLEWIKIDYNADVGDRFDPAIGDAGHQGGRLHDHLVAYYAWLDELRARHPGLVIENCASGGLRFDAGIMAHAHSTWISDRVDPVASLQLRYGCSVQFAPELCNHWMVGDTDRGVVKPGAAPGWHDFMFRVAMNGQFGISSRIHEWDAALLARAKANVALYKGVRATIASGDTYHLTGAPDAERPTGWMAIQFAAPDGSRAVVTAYRLAGGAASITFPLRALRADAEYLVSIDGHPSGTTRGDALRSRGLPVALDAEWRATVVELDLVRRP